jgi:hypothetical protein
MMPSSNRPNRKHRHAYAVVRIDIPICESQPEDSFAVVKVFSSEEIADEETARLNKINADKGSKYFTFIIRMVDERRLLLA